MASQYNFGSADVALPARALLDRDFTAARPIQGAIEKSFGARKPSRLSGLPRNFVYKRCHFQSGTRQLVTTYGTRTLHYRTQLVFALRKLLLLPSSHSSAVCVVLVLVPFLPGRRSRRRKRKSRSGVRGSLTGGTMRLLSLLLGIALLCSAMPAARAFNITKILADQPEFSTFNHYLSATHLASEINRRNTITVLVVDNHGMADVLAKHMSIFQLKNLLSLHVLADYFGVNRLHQINHRSAAVSTLFQATGAAPGTTGFVNITDLRGGKVGFGAASEESNDASLDSFFVKAVHEEKYKVAVIQITAMLRSPVAEAPTPAPSQYNLTMLMAKKGCTTFANLLQATADVEKTYESNVDGGLSVFCPVDQAMKAFMPKFRNLTADGKASLLLYHGFPVYMSMQMLKTNNGVINTLATDGTTKNYNMTVQNDGEVVTLETRIATATITGTVIDEQPLAVYTIDKVLEPRELFKVPETEAPAPAPEAESPKGKKLVSPPAPAGPESEPEDQTADRNAGARVSGGQWITTGATLATGILMMI
ncbi:hypothetical protein Taro_054911 [Colocasia esculenta]|uniref:FAS1 domain-containing protein n=1 Tax=Colocasia esculenta TaxID=4460 RepID=A0A843XRE8_COLES|nr:hypothetical protein [Colocasia esculenta]